MWKLGASLVSVLLIIINIGNVYSQKPRLGDGIKMFGMVSSLSQNVRVLPKSGNEGWFFREPTIQLFEDPEALPKVPQPENRALNEFDFHWKFCKDSTELLRTYFRRFKIEGMDEPWEVFAQDWSTRAIADLFGIRESSITDDSYSFFLMQIEKSHDNQTLAKNVVLNNENSKKIDQRVLIDSFIIPTHYINSYATGNALYQVLAFYKDHYEQFERETSSRGLEAFPKILRQIVFSPNYVRDMGRIRTASGNHLVETWATENLQFPHRYGPYSSLMKLYRNATLLNQLDKLLGDEVLLQLEMLSLARLL